MNPTPSPETARQIAAGAVARVEEKFGFALPYSPESLIVIDALVDKIKATGASERQASGFLFGLGCYVGEVFVRHARASWRTTTEMGMSSVCGFPIVLALPGKVGCNPIGQVFARFRASRENSVASLYEKHAAAPGTS